MSDTYKTFRMRKNGIVRCPITVAKAVICEDGNSIDKKIVEVNPTVPAGTTTAELTGLKVGTNYFSPPTVELPDNMVTAEEYSEGETFPALNLGTKVIANPTVPEGTTPTTLTNLKIDDGYYSAGGGGKLYRHRIAFSYNYFIMAVDIYNFNEVTYTKDTFWEYVPKTVYSSFNDNVLHAFGSYENNAVIGLGFKLVDGEKKVYIIYNTISSETKIIENVETLNYSWFTLKADTVTEV